MERYREIKGHVLELVNGYAIVDLTVCNWCNTAFVEGSDRIKEHENMCDQPRGGRCVE